jgi:penicillin-binding protein 1A
MVLMIVAGTLAGLTMALLTAVTRDLPQIQSLESFEPGAATRILAQDGSLLAELFTEKRLPLTLDEIPKELQLAVIAVEDRRFHRHPGLDLVRNFGALVADIRAGAFVEGASTITQQLARNLFLTFDKTLTRKLKEIFLALQIERRYTKDEILRLYLNQIYFGAGAYGVGAASDVYFGKPVNRLTLSECALLAGLPRSPNRYNPAEYPDRALARRKLVLQAMVREGYLAQKQALVAAEMPLKLRERSQAGVSAPYFVQYVRDILVEQLGDNAVYKGGLTVQTTLNPYQQRAAEQALTRGLADLDRRLEPRLGIPGEELQAALVALDTSDGAILAWVGGSGRAEDAQDRVARTRYRPGSAIKPLIYAEAIESGLTQADLVWDAPISYNLADRPEPFRPKNFSHRHEGEITLRRALEVSGNIPAVKILSRIGVDNFIKTAGNLGLASPLDRDLSLALGQSKVTLLELASAYNALAAHGLWMEPFAISVVKDQSGRIIHQTTPKRRGALTPETAYIVTDMLKGVITAGTAQRAKRLERPLAGQTGTNMDYQDALFAGYSPELTSVVWVGFDSERSLGQEWTGAKAALPIWMDFMAAALAGIPPRDFEPPLHIVMATMNRLTGKAVSPGDPVGVVAAFKAGTEPR